MLAHRIAALMRDAPRDMTSERNEVVFRAGIERTVWRRLSNSQPNDGWDFCCMTLILIESMKLRLSEMKPDYYEPKATEEDSDGKKQQPKRPKWGAQPVMPSIRTFGRCRQRFGRRGPLFSLQANARPGVS
jgi:hypothetical protein